MAEQPADQADQESNARQERANEDGEPQRETGVGQRAPEGRDTPPAKAERGAESPWMGGG